MCEVEKAKHAVLGMTRVAAVETAKQKIRVCVHYNVRIKPSSSRSNRCATLMQVVAMCPGLITTPGHVKAAEEVDNHLLSKVPMARFGIPDEITDGLTFLCSDMASYLTGSAFVSETL